MATIETLVKDGKENTEKLSLEAKEYQKRLEKYFLETYGQELLNYFQYKAKFLSDNMYKVIDGIKISGFEYGHESLDSDNPVYKISYNKRIYIRYKLNDDIFELEYTNQNLFEQLAILEQMIKELENANFLRWEAIVRNNLEKNNSTLMRNRAEISDKMDLLDKKEKARYIKR